MWQRPQTIYMAFSILMLLAALFMPAFSGELANGNQISVFVAGVQEQNPNTNQVIQEKTEITSIVPYIFSLALIITSILLYKNRKLQITFLMSAIGVQLLQVVAFALNFHEQIEPMDMLAKGTRGGVIVILTSMILDWLAIGLIKKDEKLVRSSRDRLR